MNKSTLIIAEAGVNHNGDIRLAKKLIDVAVEAGVNVIKFQTFKAEQLVSELAQQADYQQKNTGNPESQLDMLKKLELSFEDFEELNDYCGKKGIQFLSTAFDLESLNFIEEKLNPPFYKVPSGEITNLPYLQKMGYFNKPVILSTGMADMEEINDALQILLKAGISKEKITILHCNTEYPTPMEDVNLKALHHIRKELGVQVGYSDHTLGIEVPIAAVALGAGVIEKHFTLNRKMNGPDHKASLEPDELKSMVEAIRNIEKALGDGVKKPSRSEQKNKSIARKSVHVIEDLEKGTRLQALHLVMKRPGDGISPMRIGEVEGRQLKIAVKKGHKLQLDDLK